MTWATIYFLSEWLIRLGMLVYVPQRRPPAAARSWLLLIFVLPWPGLILYACIGRARLPKDRIELQRKVSELIRARGEDLARGEDVARRGELTRGEELAGPPKPTLPHLPPRFSHLTALASSLGDFRLTAGNRFELLDDYQETVDRLVADIDRAQHHAHLLFYIFADDRTGNQVGDALLRAAGRGVLCRLLVDGLASRRALKTLAPRLEAGGVEVRAVLPVSFLKAFRRSGARLDLRNHRKIAVVDGCVGYTGSQNIVDADFKPGLVYEEVFARIRGPVVRQLQAVFLGDRYFEGGTVGVDTEALRAMFPEIEPAGAQVQPDRPQAEPAGAPSAAAMALPSGPGYPQPNNLELIVSLIHSAERRVVLTTPYFIPTESLLSAMHSAVLRGVEVRLVVSRQIDQALVGLAQRSYYEGLLEMGVRIHAYRKRFLHAKHVSVDDSIAIIGSSNVDIRSFALNAEISVLVCDREVVSRLERIQERYFADSEEIDLETWRSRPARLKIAQNVARLADSLL